MNFQSTNLANNQSNVEKKVTTYFEEEKKNHIPLTTLSLFFVFSQHLLPKNVNLTSLVF